MPVRRNVHLRQPLLGQVTASRRLILTDVASNVGELERQAQITRTIQRSFIRRVNPPQHRHHAADGSGDMIAIAQHVRFALRPPIFSIKREPFDQVMGIARRDGAFTHHQTKAIEGRIARELSAQGGIGQRSHAGETGLTVSHAPHYATMILPVRDIIAFATPCVEKPGTLTRLPVEQLRCQGEGFGAPGDTFAGMGDESGAIENVHIAAMPRADGRRKGGTSYSLSAFIEKIGSCAL